MKRLRNLEWLDPQKLRGVGNLFLLFSALSIVAWVSVHQLLILYTRDSQIRETVRLEQEVSQLRSIYLQANPDSVDAGLQRAEQFLMMNFSQLAKWAQDLQEEGKRKHLLVEYRILQTEGMVSPIQGVDLIPLEIQVRPQGTGHGYRDQLRFIKALIRSGPKVQIQKVLLTGDGQKAIHLTIGLMIWMKAIDSVKL